MPTSPRRSNGESAKRWGSPRSARTRPSRSMSPKASPSGCRPVKGEGTEPAPGGSTPMARARWIQGSASHADGGRRPSGSARDRALALLAVRWRSEAELQRRLRAAGVPDEGIEEALAGLERAGLIDDERFAREVVRDQVARRRASGGAMRAALRQKGVAADVADAAIEEAGSGGERGRELAEPWEAQPAGTAPEVADRAPARLLVRGGDHAVDARGAPAH